MIKQDAEHSELLQAIWQGKENNIKFIKEQAKWNYQRESKPFGFTAS